MPLTAFAYMSVMMYFDTTSAALAIDGPGQPGARAMPITVLNGAPPSGGGLAALYPGDAGIENHPDVVFVERFDEPTLTDLFKRWTDILNGPAMSFTSDVPPGSPVSRALNIPWKGGGISSGGQADTVATSRAVAPSRRGSAISVPVMVAIRVSMPSCQA